MIVKNNRNKCVAAVDVKKRLQYRLMGSYNGQVSSKKQASGPIRNLIDSYMSHRQIKADKQNRGFTRFSFNTSVMEYPIQQNTKILPIVIAANYKEVIIKEKNSVEKILKRIRKKILEVAEHKTKALILIEISITEGLKIRIGMIKIQHHKNMLFEQNLRYILKKTQKRLAKLSKILTNISNSELVYIKLLIKY